MKGDCTRLSSYCTSYWLSQLQLELKGDDLVGKICTNRIYHLNRDLWPKEHKVHPACENCRADPV